MIMNTPRTALTVLATLLSLTAGAVAQSEAPALAEQVAAGTLPALAERLPSEPEIITPIEGIGTYGGLLHSGMVGASDQSILLRWIGGQGLVRWNGAHDALIPNIAASYEVSDDQKVFTFKLRDGLKWSDGTPMTADDVAFAVNDVILNEELMNTASRYKAGGKPVVFEVVDPDTVRFTFDVPNAMFLVELARWEGQGPVYYPKHYCSQFHADHNPDVATLVTAAGAQDWQTLFAQKCGDERSAARFMNTEKPTMDPWLLTAPYDGGATRVAFERNPYFWQVDTEGNQLPYIDGLDVTVYQDAQALLLAAISGKIDWQFRKIEAAINRPVLADNMEAGDYDLYEMTALGGSHMLFVLNLTHKDPELRELFNQKDFRVALSHGIDRPTMIETVLLGTSTPHQGGAFADSPLYNETFSTQYLDYDPEAANGLLDGIGLTERNADGIRLLPSGKPLKFIVDVFISDQPEFIDMLQLLEQDWAEIGVDIDVNATDGTLFQARQEANDADAAVWNSQEAWVPGQLAWSVVPVDTSHSAPWSAWYTSGGTKGEEPPESIKQRLALWDQSRQTLDPAERGAIIKQLTDIAAAEFEVIGTAASPSTYGIKKNDLRNVPPSMPASSIFPGPALSLPQSWYWAAE